MKKVILCLIILLLVGCQEEIEISSERQLDDHYISLNFQSKVLEGNTTGISTSRYLLIHLPPNYEQTDKRYPVIYYIHGYTERIGLFTNSRRLFNEMETHQLKEVIFVEIDASTPDGGSFMANSSVNGNWEAHLFEEIIPLVDRNFRTISKKSSRGIAGFSMGGVASLNLSLQYPDVFSAVFAVSPAVFNQRGLDLFLISSEDDFVRAYALAFAPDLETELGYTHPNEDLELRAKWYSGFGNFEEKIADYLEKDSPVQFRIDYGTRDFYEWIPPGCIYVSELMEEQHMSIEIHEYERGHTFNLNNLIEEVIPFFEQHLKYE